MGVVAQVEIEIAHVAEHHGIAVVGNGVGDGVAVPFSHGVPAVDGGEVWAQLLVDVVAMAHCRFLPSSDFVAFRCNHIGYAGDEVFFNFVSGCESFLCHQTLHCGRFRPWVFRHFVAAHVDVWQRDACFTIHQDNLVNNFFH